jgi:propionyl-CoA synthetase
MLRGIAFPPERWKRSCNTSDVAECAVIGRKDGFKGQLPLGFVVLKSGVKKEPALIVGDLVRMVRDQIGAFACFKEAIVVKRLPKTRSGKILRGTMRKMVDKETFRVPPTIDDPAILKEVEEALKLIKLGD